MGAVDTAALIAAARAEGRRALAEDAAKLVLSSFGLRVPRTVVVPGPEQAPAALAGLHMPVVVKVVSPDILHKSDVGGVAVGLGDADAVVAAIRAMLARPEIAAARRDGFLIEEMAEAGQELVIGGVRDPRFGPLVMVGLGGILVEVLADVAFRICPITAADARAMLAELKGAALLRGARGRPAVDEGAVVSALLAVAGADGLLMRHADAIAEVDVNPLIAGPGGAVAVDARIVLADAPLGARAAVEAGGDLVARFGPLFRPATVAVVGASATGMTVANTFLRRLKAMEYPGTVFPIHPSAAEVEGLKTYPTLAATPAPVDYAYIAVGAQRVPEMLAAADGRVAYAQVISSGFGEVAEGVALQEALVAAARAGGCRLLGPNCLGIYSPAGRVSFAAGASAEVGTIGIISQSGGLGTDIMRRGLAAGIRFSGLVTVGNSADLGPSDLLAYYLADPGTRAVGLYIEDAKDGRRFFELLRGARKPVVLLKGGRTRQGQLAAASHTGSLAGDDRVWVALSRQTGCVLVETLEEFLDVLLAFQALAPRPARPTARIVLFGNGGGTSVLATDYFARRGLDVSPFGADTLARLEALKLPPGTSIGNPIDAPVATLQQEQGRIAEKIVEAVFETAPPDAFVMHLNFASFLGRGDDSVIDRVLEAALRVQSRYPGQAHFALVLRSDGEAEVEARKRAYRATATERGILVYDELANAAHGLAAVQHVERVWAGRG